MIIRFNTETIKNSKEELGWCYPGLLQVVDNIAEAHLNLQQGHLTGEAYSLVNEALELTRHAQSGLNNFIEELIAFELRCQSMPENPLPVPPILLPLDPGFHPNLPDFRPKGPGFSPPILAPTLPQPFPLDLGSLLRPDPGPIFGPFFPRAPFPPLAPLWRYLMQSVFAAGSAAAIPLLNPLFSYAGQATGQYASNAFKQPPSDLTVNELTASMQEMVKKVLNFPPLWAANPLLPVTTKTSNLLEQMGDFLGNGANQTWQFACNIYNNVVTGGQQVVNFLTEHIGQAITSLSNFLQQSWAYVSAKLHDFTSFLQDSFSIKPGVYQPVPVTEFQIQQKMETYANTDQAGLQHLCKSQLETLNNYQKLERDYLQDPANLFGRWLGGIGLGQEPDPARYEATKVRLEQAYQLLQSGDPAQVAEGKRLMAQATLETQAFNDQWNAWMNHSYNNMEGQKKGLEVALAADIALAVAVTTPEVAGVLFEVGAETSPLLGLVYSTTAAGGIGFAGGAGRSVVMDAVELKAPDLHKALDEGMVEGLLNMPGGLLPAQKFMGDGISMVFNGSLNSMYSGLSDVLSGKPLDFSKMGVAFAASVIGGGLSGENLGLARSIGVSVLTGVGEEATNQITHNEFDGDALAGKILTGAAGPLLTHSITEDRLMKVVIDPPEGVSPQRWAALMGKTSNKSPMEIYRLAAQDGFTPEQALLLAAAKKANQLDHYPEGTERTGYVRDGQIVTDFKVAEGYTERATEGIGKISDTLARLFPAEAQSAGAEKGPFSINPGRLSEDILKALPIMPGINWLQTLLESLPSPLDGHALTPLRVLASAGVTAQAQAGQHVPEDVAKAALATRFLNGSWPFILGGEVVAAIETTILKIITGNNKAQQEQSAEAKAEVGQKAAEEKAKAERQAAEAKAQAEQKAAEEKAKAELEQRQQTEHQLDIGRKALDYGVASPKINPHSQRNDYNWYGYCLGWVNTATQANGGHVAELQVGTAKMAYEEAVKHGKIHEGNPPPGAIVFFPDYTGEGHVGIVSGPGTYRGTVPSTENRTTIADRPIPPDRMKTIPWMYPY
ncbi:MAG TPA: CHAP domain-containing protein [Chloroflexia bacterium]|nr:CHAP domain-containing protein [Chloroflexia bacterium]